MKKVYHLRKYCYYCNDIRAKYQEKRNKKMIKKIKVTNNRSNILIADTSYTSLEITYSNINKIIDNIETLKNKDSFIINFRKLNRFDLGLCLIFTSLLKELREIKKTPFGFRKDLMPKSKKIRSMFIQTGIFEILCDKQITNKVHNGRIRILEVYINSQIEFKKVLLRISNELIVYSLMQIDNIEDHIQKLKIKLNKIFDELLLNVKSHSQSLDKRVYLAGEVENNILKFAILDSGIGFVGSIKARSKVIDMGKEILANTNYVEMIFETNKNRDREYSGVGFKRGNGTRRLKETIEKCKGKLQIVSKKDFYQLEYSNHLLRYEKLAKKVKENSSIGTLINFELPILEFLKGVKNANI